jgi:ethanolamine utilization protein EutA
MVDGDVGKLLGHLLEHELGLTRGVVSVDGIRLHEFDYVDVGERMQPAQAVPLVIKTLLFPAH